MPVNYVVIDEFVKRLLDFAKSKGYSVSAKDIVVRIVLLLSENEDVEVEFDSNGEILFISAPPRLLDELKDLADEFEEEYTSGEE
jgi:hypothetical protein